MTSVLVLGESGMLGQTVGRYLRERGFAVTGTSRRGREGTIAFDAAAGADAAASLMAQHGPFQLVINCAAVLRDQMDPADQESVAAGRLVNEQLPHQLEALAAVSGGRLVHISTDAVFPADAGDCTEETPVSPDDVYGETKARGEVSGERSLTVRCSLVGPNARGRGLYEWIRAQPPGAAVNGFSDQRWSGVTTLQLAHLCAVLADEPVFMAARAEGAVHHFCPNATTTKLDLVRDLSTALRPDVVVRAAMSGAPVTRALATVRGALPAQFGREAPLRAAIVGAVAYDHAPIQRDHECQRRS